MVTKLTNRQVDLPVGGEWPAEQWKELLHPQLRARAALLPLVRQSLYNGHRVPAKWHPSELELACLVHALPLHGHRSLVLWGIPTSGALDEFEWWLRSDDCTGAREAASKIGCRHLAKVRAAYFLERREPPAEVFPTVKSARQTHSDVVGRWEEGKASRSWRILNITEDSAAKPRATRPHLVEAFCLKHQREFTCTARKALKGQGCQDCSEPRGSCTAREIRESLTGVAVRDSTIDSLDLVAVATPSGRLETYPDSAYPVQASTAVYISVNRAGSDKGELYRVPEARQVVGTPADRGQPETSRRFPALVRGHYRTPGRRLDPNEVRLARRRSQVFDRTGGAVWLEEFYRDAPGNSLHLCTQWGETFQGRPEHVTCCRCKYCNTTRSKSQLQVEASLRELYPDGAYTMFPEWPHTEMRSDAGHRLRIDAAVTRTGETMPFVFVEVSDCESHWKPSARPRHWRRDYDPARSRDLKQRFAKARGIAFVELVGPTRSGVPDLRSELESKLRKAGVL